MKWARQTVEVLGRMLLGPTRFLNMTLTNVIADQGGNRQRPLSEPKYDIYCPFKKL